MAIRGILIALIILMSALLVMVIRIMSGSAPVENNPPAEIVLEDSVLDVRTEVFEEATLERIIELAGQTAASRRETIVAQSGGTLSEIRVDKGDVVAVGDVIAMISADARDENLRQAEQALVAAEIDLDATRALVEEGFVARNTLADLETAYEAALAAVEQAREEPPAPRELNLAPSVHAAAGHAHLPPAPALAAAAPDAGPSYPALVHPAAAVHPVAQTPHASTTSDSFWFRSITT